MCVQVHQLHTVLLKKRDPHTQVCFLDTIVGVSVTFSLPHSLPHSPLSHLTQSPAHHLLTHFWEAITEDLGVELVAAAKGPHHTHTFTPSHPHTLTHSHPHTLTPSHTASMVMNQAFESDYPKLVRVFSELLVKIEQVSIAESTPSLYHATPTTTESGCVYLLVFTL